MATLEELQQKFDFGELEKQLELAIESHDPVGYMESNINWQIDKDVDNDQELSPLTKMLSTQLSGNKGYTDWKPLSKFLNWFNRSKSAKTVKKILCASINELNKLWDEKAELTKYLGVAITAVATAIGIGAINPLIITLIVGLLATMILKGIDNVCAL